MKVNKLGIYNTFNHPFPPERLRDELKKSLQVDIVVVNDSGLADCDAVISLGHFDEFLEHVDWVHEIRSGYNDYPLNQYEAEQVMLTNSRGLPTTMVSETTVGYMLTFSRGLHRFQKQQENNNWKRLSWERPFTINRSSACIIGMGQIGSGVANRASIFGMDTVGVDVRPVSTLGVEHIYDVHQISNAISDVRFVVLTTPLNETTRGLIDREELAEMRDDAFLINVSRGEIINQSALIDALNDNEIAGAALDVFDNEPLPVDSPLWDKDEVIVTPHAAGQANHYQDLIADLIKTNILRIKEGDEPWNRVV